jgi:hypothetical protein
MCRGAAAGRVTLRHVEPVNAAEPEVTTLWARGALSRSATTTPPTSPTTWTTQRCADLREILDPPQRETLFEI